jgi:DNA-binding PadR family transcriptional regulator
VYENSIFELSGLEEDYMTMTSIDPDCPCTGKNMRNLAAPWILLALFNQDGTHGYEIGKIVSGYLEDTQAGLNLAGLYRHLNVLERRGMVLSKWDIGARGPAKRRYFLTEAGRECLWRWIGTLGHQIALLAKFFDQVRGVFPDVDLPVIVPATVAR